MIAGLPDFVAVSIWFVAVSTIVFLMMAWDKNSAVQQGWRIPENTLLFWSMIGGGVGAKLAQRMFRHKTRKEPFRSFLNVALWVNAVLFVVLAVPMLREQVLALLKYLLA